MIAEQQQLDYDSSNRDWRFDGKILWYEGNINLLASAMASVVGTRNPSPEGVKRAKRLTTLLVREGFTIVSGLAAGIDAIAHTQALEAGGNTIAVMGTPIDQCYPASHASLKQAIAELGLVLSQFPPGSHVFRSNFPHRNVLMAALSSITFIVEARADSGTRHQVAAAIEMGRRVAFLASLVDKQIPWVSEAINAGVGTIVDTPESLTSLLGEVRESEPARSFWPAEVKREFKPPDVAAPKGREIIAYWSSLIDIDERGRAVVGRKESDRPNLAPITTGDLFTNLESPSHAPGVEIQRTQQHQSPITHRESWWIVACCRRLWNSFAVLSRHRTD